MDVCSTYNTSRLQSERVNFSAAVLKEVTQKAGYIHCDVTDLQVWIVLSNNLFNKCFLIFFTVYFCGCC